MATTTTDRNGAYQFNQVDLGTYTVRETGSTGTTQEQTVSLTKGEAVTAIDFVEGTVTTPVKPNPGPRPGRNFPGGCGGKFIGGGDAANANRSRLLSGTGRRHIGV